MYNMCTYPVHVDPGDIRGLNLVHFSYDPPNTQSLYARARTMIVSKMPFY